MGRRSPRSSADADPVYLPPGSANISRAAAEATVDWVSGPYRFEVVDDAHQPILPAEPEKLTELLVAHLTEHAH